MAKILCIDDEPSSSRKLLLESEGHEVVEARSGAEGLRLFPLQKFDVVIVDYFMPGMNGMQTAQELKALDPAIPVLMLSGFTELPGEAILVNQWIMKGHSTQDLLDAITRITHR